MTMQERITEYFDTCWYTEDFIGAYCEAKGIAFDELTDEEYDQFFKEVDNILTPPFLESLRDIIIEEANERILATMRWELSRKAY